MAMNMTFCVREWFAILSLAEFDAASSSVSSVYLSLFTEAVDCASDSIRTAIKEMARIEPFINVY